MDVWIKVNGQSAGLRKNPVGPVAQGSLEAVLRYAGEALSLSVPQEVVSRPSAPDTTRNPPGQRPRSHAGSGVVCYDICLYETTPVSAPDVHIGCSPKTCRMQSDIPPRAGYDDVGLTGQNGVAGTFGDSATLADEAQP